MFKYFYVNGWGVKDGWDVPKAILVFLIQVFIAQTYTLGDTFSHKTNTHVRYFI